MNISLTGIKFGYQTILYSLLFLLPLFTISVRHWTSITFSLLILLGLIYYFHKGRTNPVQLSKYEKWFLWLHAIFFIIFLITMSVNYPDRFSNTNFGNEVRFLLIIPLYFMIRHSRYSMRYLSYGCIAAVPIAFGFGLYEIYYMGDEVFRGVYSQLLVGPVLLIMAIVIFGIYFPRVRYANIYQKIALLLIGIMAGYCIILTGVRVAYITVLVGSFLFILFYLKGWSRGSGLLILVALLLLVFFQSAQVRDRMEMAYTSFNGYISAENKSDSENPDLNTSVGTRLEMIRSAQFYLRDYPILGIGNGNYKKQMKKYVEMGLLNKTVIEHSHAHNVFIHTLISKGLFGLAILLLLLLFPVYVYIKTGKSSRYSAYTGILFITSILLISLNETAPFYKSNFVAIFLIFNIVIFGNHMQKIKNDDKYNHKV